MSRDVTPAHDVRAEEVVASTAMLGSAVSELVRIVAPVDFYEPALGQVFDVCAERFRRGDPVDPTLVARDLGPDGLRVVERLLAVRDEAGAAHEYALDVARASAARRLQALAVDVLNSVGDREDPGDVRDRTMAALADVELPHDVRPISGLYTADEMLDGDFPVPEPVVPGFLRVMDRLMVVGVEGSGKSWFLRQIGAACASGQSPLTFAPMEPRRALLIDAENPEYVVRENLQAMQRYRKGSSLTILSRPGGMDVRSRRDRDLLHRVCEQVRPEVVCAGPLYKLYRTEPRENDEQAAVACQNALDDLRARWGFALVLEHHAPKGQGSTRDLVPFGSSAWLRWPEFGWKLIPHRPNSDNSMGEDHPAGASLRIAGFRGDRVKIVRPGRLDRNPHGGWPWAPYWPDGVPEELRASRASRSAPERMSGDHDDADVPEAF